MLLAISKYSSSYIHSAVNQRYFSNIVSSDLSGTIDKIKSVVNRGNLSQEDAAAIVAISRQLTSLVDRIEYLEHHSQGLYQIIQATKHSLNMIHQDYSNHKSSCFPRMCPDRRLVSGLDEHITDAQKLLENFEAQCLKSHLSTKL